MAARHWSVRLKLLNLTLFFEVCDYRALCLRGVHYFDDDYYCSNVVYDDDDDDDDYLS